jgi:hypothetical protein
VWLSFQEETRFLTSQGVACAEALLGLYASPP